MGWGVSHLFPRLAFLPADFLSVGHFHLLHPHRLQDAALNPASCHSTVSNGNHN